MPEINIPFPGFYESWLSQEIDHEEERYAEYRADEEEPATYPAPVALSASDIADAMWRHVSYGIAHESVARAYLESFDTWAGEILGETRPAWVHRWKDGNLAKVRESVPSCGMRFSLMTSPREYNFETDRLFVEVSGAFINRLFRKSKADNHATLHRVIRERFTSRDGFISHYSNRLADWLAKPLADWDYNETGTLLRAALALDGADDAESVMWEVLESGAAYDAFSAACDFAGLDAALMEKRAEKLQTWLETDPEAASAWRAAYPETCAAVIAADPSLFDDTDWRDGDAVGSFYRCPETPDMFGAFPQ